MLGGSYARICYPANPSCRGEVCLWPLSFNIGAGMQGLGVRKPRVIALMAGRSIREFMATSNHSPTPPAGVLLVSFAVAYLPAGLSSGLPEPSHLGDLRGEAPISIENLSQLQ